VGHIVVTIPAPGHTFLFLYGHNASKGGLGWATRIVGEDAANNNTGGGQWSGWGMTNKKQQPTIDGSSAMMEMMEQAADNEKGQMAMKWTYDDRQKISTINHWWEWQRRAGIQLWRQRLHWWWMGCSAVVWTMAAAKKLAVMAGQQ
jgi:hypothetical protein